MVQLQIHLKHRDKLDSSIVLRDNGDLGDIGIALLNPVNVKGALLLISMMQLIINGPLEEYILGNVFILKCDGQFGLPALGLRDYIDC